MAFAPRATALALAGMVVWGGAAWGHETAKTQDAGPAPEQSGSGEEAVTQPTPSGHGDALPFDIGAPFSLVDHTGARRSDHDFHGRHMAVFFGYTSCPRTCSMALLNLARALDLMGNRAAEVQPLMVTVDPAYDTPERLADFVARIDPRLIGLTGPSSEIAKLLKAYRSHAEPAADPGQYKRLVHHSSFIYLMGPEGGFETILPPVMGPEQMARVIASYLD